ncbi:MAG: Na+/H+ antiporter NhaA [Neomegalonema sp.]|nr:Na+/H+ antiporter NhaA [Neomegalonema sp.]
MANTQTSGSGNGTRGYRVWNFLSEYSLLLIFGALLALIWANTNAHGYHHFVEYPLLFNDFIGAHADKWLKHLKELKDPMAIEYATEAAAAARVLTVHYLINDVLMALFFAIAGKEVWEAVILKNGSLRGRKALTPLIATAGGMLGPIAIYFLIAIMTNQLPGLANGWAVPTATDIAFSYLIGRLVFGAGHPAVRFLLLLAIADDAAGLIILAIFYPQGDLAPEWLLVSFGVAALVYLLFNYLPRRKDVKRDEKVAAPKVHNRFGPWPYIIGGCVSWYGFQEAGIHPALGLLPIIPAIPHADNFQGFFAAAEETASDMLNTLEHALKTPVELILFFFGLANAGVAFSSMNAATWAVLGGLIIGKPLGIWIMGTLAANGLKLGLPEGMKNTDLVVLGMVAAIGFTVSLFVAAVAFPAGEFQEGAKMGALLSFAAAALSFVCGRLFKVEKKDM